MKAVAIYYTLEDLSYANYILANKDGVHFFTGEEDRPFFNQEFISWAHKVVRWFNALYTIARIYKRAWKMHWTLAVKAVWQYIKGMEFAGKLFTLLRWVKNEACTRMRASGAVNDIVSRSTYVELPYYIAKEVVTGKTRAAKSMKLIHYRAETYKLERKFGNGQWQV